MDYDYHRINETFNKCLAIIRQAEPLNGVDKSKLQGKHSCAELNLSDGSIRSFDIKFTARISERQTGGVVNDAILDKID